MRPGEGARALAVEIPFEAVADGFVEQHARPAGAEHHRHRPGRRRHRIQIDQRRAHGFLGMALGGIGVEQPSGVEASAAAAEAALSAPVLLGDHGHVETRQRTHVGAQRAIGGHHQTGLVLESDAHGDFLHSRILGAGKGVDAPQQVDFGVFAGGGDGIHRGVAHWRLGARSRLHCARAAAAGNAARRVGGVRKRRQGDVVGVGEARLLAADGAHPDAPIDAEGAALHGAVLQHPRLSTRDLKEQLAGVDAARRQAAKEPRDIAIADAASVPQRRPRPLD